MNVTGPGVLTDVDVQSITADVTSMINDTDAGVEIVLATPGTSSFDPASGTVTATDTIDTAQGYQAPLSLREIDGSGGVYQVGDIRVCVLAADLTEAPTTSTAFRIAGVRHGVVGVERDPLGIFFELIGRRTT